MVEKTLPKPRMNAQERRVTILDAALKLFGEKGFRGTTTRELAAAVGVTEPVLYEHFKTKGELYTAIIEARSQVAMERFAALREEFRESEDDRGFLTALAGLILELYSSDPAYARLLLYSGLENHELKDLFIQRQKCAFFEFVSEYLGRRIAQGAIRPLDTQLMARAFAGMVAHYGQACMLFDCATLGNPRNEVIAGMVEIFLGGIQTQKGNA